MYVVDDLIKSPKPKSPLIQQVPYRSTETLSYYIIV